MDAPGKLLAKGRDADVYEYGPHAVLRRSREGRSQQFDADVMAYVASHGYPVPAIIELSDDGRDLVMERVSGPTMIEAAASQPWRLARFGQELAALHHTLHEIDAPPWLPPAPCGSGGQVLHLDLHPLNVIVTSRGPVVIDWSNAVAGDPRVDVVATWVLLAAADAPGGRLERALAKVGRGVLLRNFLRTFPHAERAAMLSAVVEWKARDAHMSPAEIARMRALR